MIDSYFSIFVHIFKILFISLWFFLHLIMPSSTSFFKSLLFTIVFFLKFNYTIFVYLFTTLIISLWFFLIINYTIISQEGVCNMTESERALSPPKVGRACERRKTDLCLSATKKCLQKMETFFWLAFQIRLSNRHNSICFDIFLYFSVFLPIFLHFSIKLYKLNNFSIWCLCNSIDLNPQFINHNFYQIHNLLKHLQYHF